ncbi:class I SAM-dependent methyltransferase [Arsenicicoccus dermatophilus]|uniref:class I SAM-dependent methyltransferase n=1 Tax=Arsenicicoccus dermatophilus TaxID=1076331 RepID=UPI003916D3AB
MPTPEGPADDYDAATVAEHDDLNPDGPDHDYFRALADDLAATCITDLGCGTGILTVTLTQPGRTVTGIDPSARMLTYAAAHPGGHRVQWRHGTSEQLPPGQDLVLMTGNIAMHILDPHWHTTVCDSAATLRPGGVLAFETRNTTPPPSTRTTAVPSRRRGGSLAAA